MINIKDKIIYITSYLEANNSYFYDTLNYIMNLLSFINKDYPSFSEWFINKVIPDLIKYKREIIIYQEDNIIKGIIILKNKEEKKICTLWVSPKYRNLGIAKILIERSFSYLKTDKPIISITKEHYEQFRFLFKRYNFELTSIKPNIYKNNTSELFFNENRL